MSIFEELKRRNVFRVSIAYLVVGWLLLQVTDIVVPILELPEWVDKLVLFLIMLGFPLVIFFAWAFELTPEGIKREAEVDRSQSITPVTGHKLDRAIIGILVVALAWFAWDKFVREPASHIETAAITEEEAAMAPEENIKSIAVLPFVNMSDESENEYFSDGISEEILNALASVDDLKVAGRTSSFAFKGRNEDLRTIGEALGVNHILEGSVRKAGNTVRITAQLVQVDDGFHLWSDTYDRELTNVFAIQDEIANAILTAMKAELLAGESEAMASTETDPQAYELYLLAKQRIYERKQDAMEAAISLLDSALAIDPDYAPALAQRSIATILLKRRHYGSLSSEEADPVALDFAKRALETDPGSAEGWAAMGLYYREQPSQHHEAIEVLEKALEINPNMINAMNWLHSEYFSTGQAEKGQAILEEMVARDPLYKPGIGNTVLFYTSRGRTDLAMAVIDRAELYLPGDPKLKAERAFVLLLQGRIAESILLYEESFEAGLVDGSARIGWGFGLLATRQYEKLLNAYMPPGQRIYAMHALGRKEEATISAYEQAADGNIDSLLELMNREGRPRDVVRFFDERWVDLDSFQAEYPGGSFHYDEMLALAYAFMKVGDEVRHADAMRRLGVHLDYLESQGMYGDQVNFTRACWHLMNGDADSAIAQIEEVVRKNAANGERITWEFPALAPLEGDPRFEALQTQMIERVNEERAKLGLEPIET